MKEDKKENIKDEDIDLGRFFEIASSSQIYVNGLNSHEIKSELLREYTGEFELKGSMVIGPVEHKKILDLAIRMILKVI